MLAGDRLLKVLKVCLYKIGLAYKRMDIYRQETEEQLSKLEKSH
jgi:hypothetical protein